MFFSVIKAELTFFFRILYGKKREVVVEILLITHVSNRNFTYIAWDSKKDVN